MIEKFGRKGTELKGIFFTEGQIASAKVVGDAVFSARVVDDAVFSALTVKGLAMAGGYISAHSAVGASAHGGGTSWLSRFRYSPS